MEQVIVDIKCALNGIKVDTNKSIDKQKFRKKGRKSENEMHKFFAHR